MKALLKILCILLFNSFAYGQSDSSIQVSKNFKFNDGIYRTFDAFQKNTPSYSWGKVHSEFFTNPKTLLTHVAFIEFKNKDIELDSLWGICISGVPYIRVKRFSTEESTVFVGIKLRGKICYFTYDDVQEVSFPISAYNPLTGHPFRTALINRQEPVIREKILDFESGLIKDMTVSNLLDWIADDHQLSASIRQLSPKEAQNKLFKCLLIYDDRHPVYIY